METEEYIFNSKITEFSDDNKGNIKIVLENGEIITITIDCDGQCCELFDYKFSETVQMCRERLGSIVVDDCPVDEGTLLSIYKNRNYDNNFTPTKRDIDDLNILRIMFRFFNEYPIELLITNIHNGYYGHLIKCNFNGKEKKYWV